MSETALEAADDALSITLSRRELTLLRDVLAAREREWDFFCRRELERPAPDQTLVVLCRECADEAMELTHKLEEALAGSSIQSALEALKTFRTAAKASGLM